MARAFDDLYDAGKVRAFGVSNHTPRQIEYLSRWIRRPIVANQLQLSLMHAPMIAQAIARILKAGKAPGILATSEPQARKWLAAGARFVAVGADTMLLDSGARALLAKYKDGAGAAGPSSY